MIRLAVLVAGALIAQQVVRDGAVPPVPAGTAIVSGVVLSAEATPQPVRRARVTLNEEGRAVAGRTTTTDDNGRFTFASVVAGRYAIEASKPAFLNVRHGAKRPDGAGTPLTVKDGERHTIEMRIHRGAVITGTVFDASGRPLAGVSIDPLRYAYSVVDGERSLSNFVRVTTDDRGVYRCWGLPPGEYVVRADLNPIGRGRGASALDEVRRLSADDIQRALAWANAGRGIGAIDTNAPAPQPQGELVAFAPTFYPGVFDVLQTPALKLAVGEERSGIDIIMRRAPTAKIRGTIAAVEGLPPNAFNVTLRPTGPQSLLLGLPFQPVTQRASDSGAFMFTGVGPGTYAVAATPIAGAITALPADAPARKMWAMAEVAVDGRDQTVALEMRPGIPVSARFVFEGTAPAPKILPDVRIYLIPPGSGGVLNVGALGVMNADGTVTFESVLPGRYRVFGPLVQPAGALAPYRLQSAMANGRDAMDFGVDVRAGVPVEITFVYRDQSTGVSGVLQDLSGRPATEYTIVAIAADRSYWLPASRRIQSVRPATDGRFQLNGLPAGDYLIAALTDIEPGDLNDRAFLEQLVAGAIKVSLADGQKLVQDIRLK